MLPQNVIITCWLNKMKYVEIDPGPWDNEPDGLFVRLLKRVIPEANPDLETQLYPQTRKWWIELDEKRIAQREIGFNEEGIPIVIGPIGRNYGLAVDSSAPWPENYTESDEAAKLFEQYWEQLYPRFTELT